MASADTQGEFRPRDDEWPAGYDGHLTAQRRWIAEMTTATERMEWLGEVLETLKEFLPSRLGPPEGWEKE